MEQQLCSTLDWAQTPDSRPTCPHLLWLCFGLCVSLWQPAVSLYAGTSHSFHATIPISRDRSVDVAVPGDVSCYLDLTLSAVSLSGSEVARESGAIHPEFNLNGRDHLCDLSAWTDNIIMSPNGKKSVHWIQVAEDGVQSWSRTNFLFSITVGSVLRSTVSCQAFCCMKTVTAWSALLTSWSVVLQKLSSPLADQDICILWHPKFHCHVHINLTLVPILSQFSLFCILALNNALIVAVMIINTVDH
jgi:hypothetical protein